MNCSQSKDLVSTTCLAGALVACRSLTQEMASSSPFTVMTNIFVTEFVEHLGKMINCYHKHDSKSSNTYGVMLFWEKESR